MLLYPFKAVYPDLKKVPHDGAFFDNAREEYLNYKAAGQYLVDEKNAIYIYEMKKKDAVINPRQPTTQNQIQQRTTNLGLIACVSIEDYIHGTIKKHETTLRHNENLHLDLLKDRNAAIKPVLLTYPHVKEIDALLEKLNQTLPIFYTLTLDDTVHTFKQLNVENKKDYAQLLSLFAKSVAAAYIADGHHRCATTASYYQQGNKMASQLLCAFFGDNQMTIQPFHRWYKEKTKIVGHALSIDKTKPIFSDQDGILQFDNCKLNHFFEMEYLIGEDILQAVYKTKLRNHTSKKYPLPNKQGQMTLFLNRKWYRLTLRDSLPTTPMV